MPGRLLVIFSSGVRGRTLATTSHRHVPIWVYGGHPLARVILMNGNALPLLAGLLHDVNATVWSDIHIECVYGWVPFVAVVACAIICTGRVDASSVAAAGVGASGTFVNFLAPIKIRVALVPCLAGAPTAAVRVCANRVDAAPVSVVFAFVHVSQQLQIVVAGVIAQNWGILRTAPRNHAVRPDAFRQNQKLRPNNTLRIDRVVDNGSCACE